jgi:hypothetical protein
MWLTIKHVQTIAFRSLCEDARIKSLFDQADRGLSLAN